MSQKISEVKLESGTNNGSYPLISSKQFRVLCSRADILIVWLILVFANILNHHLIPLDETRYASVAWEMWSRQDYLVPYLNGLPYHHKPPLLFWLYELGWSLFGVNDLWLLLVSPLCALISLYQVRYLAGLLWPDNPVVIRMAPWWLFGSLLWGAFLNTVMFDTLLTVCVLLAMTGLIKAARDLRWQSWALYALGCGLGLLAKGPVVFVFILMPFLAGFVWSSTVRNNCRLWYIQGSVAIVTGIILALCWAIPAIISAGDSYGGTLLWHQTVDRMTNSFAHRRPLWWYLMLSPVIFFPWFFWPRTWRNLCKRELLKDFSFRLCLIWFATAFIGFSVISGKQVHYLIPLLPALALMLSRAMPDRLMDVKPNDFLPFLTILIFGLILLILPLIPGLKLYHWLQNRLAWWAFLIILTGLGGILTIAKTRSISPYHVSMAVLMVLAISLAGFFSSTGNAFHLRDAAQQLEVYRKLGDPIAWAGKYDGQFQFLLRSTEPMEVIDKNMIDSWLRSHPHGHVISIKKVSEESSQSLKIDYMQYYREDKLWIQSLR